MASKKVLMLVPWFIILVFCFVIGFGLAESRINTFGTEITYYHSFPVSIAGIYFFTIISIISAFAVAEIKLRNIFKALFITICGLAFYEAVFALVYAVYSGNMHLLLPEYNLPSSGWPGYATWFLEEILIFLLSYPLWERMKFGRLQAAILMIFFCSFLVWLYGFNFLYPPLSFSPEVLSINTIAEVSGTILLPVSMAPKGSGRTGM